LFKVSPEDPSSWAQGDGFTDVKLSLNCRSECEVLFWQAGGDPVIKEILRVPHSNHSTERWSTATQPPYIMLLRTIFNKDFSLLGNNAVLIGNSYLI
jgi:hypothetical protein